MQKAMKRDAEGSITEQRKGKKIEDGKKRRGNKRRARMERKEDIKQAE